MITRHTVALGIVVGLACGCVTLASVQVFQYRVGVVAESLRR